jgi:hypothetical protein
MNMINHVEQSVIAVEDALSGLEKLQSKCSAIEAAISDNLDSEKDTLWREDLTDTEKRDQILSLRTLAEVLQANLKKAQAELFTAQDAAIQAGLQAHGAINQFRDSLRAQAITEASVKIDELLHLPKGESIHFANRARKVHQVDSVELLSWVGSRRDIALANLARLHGIWSELQAIA